MRLNAGYVKFNAGDVVRLKGGGGPRMAVEQFDERGAPVVRCVWWTDGQGFDRGTFPPGTLELVPAPRRRLRGRVGR